MVGGTKLNLVSMDQMRHEHIVVVTQLKVLQKNSFGGEIGKMGLS
jgi:hypothetical protein